MKQAPKADKSDRRTWDELRLSIQLCTALAMFLAAALCAYALLLYLVRGAAPFARHGTTLGEVLLAYVIGMALAGVIVGLLLPFARHRWGAPLVGAVAFMPFYASVRVAMDGFAPWTGDDVFVVILCSIAVGGLVGAAYRRMFLG